MQKAPRKKAADCNVLKWEGLVEARKAKLLGDFQHRGRISLPESAGIAVSSVTVPGTKRCFDFTFPSARLCQHQRIHESCFVTPAWPQCLLLPWIIGYSL